MQNIIFLILGLVAGYFIGRRSCDTFSLMPEEEKAEMQKGSREALHERTEERKEKILEEIGEQMIVQKMTSVMQVFLEMLNHTQQLKQ